MASSKPWFSSSILPRLPVVSFAMTRTERCWSISGYATSMTTPVVAVQSTTSAGQTTFVQRKMGHSTEVDA